MSTELAGAVANVGFWHDVGRNHAVLRSEVSHTGVSAAVGERMLEKPAHHLAIDGLFACVNDALQEEVALLELIEEEEVALTEDKVLRVELLHRPAPQHIKSRKEPATTTALLVGNACVLNLDAEVLVLGTCILLIDGHLCDADIADSIAERLLGWRTGIAALELLEHLGCDACLRTYQHAEHHCQCVD